MSLADDLLRQAERLATMDPRRPRQVNLRRAVSGAYYALFHLLTDEAARAHATGVGFRARVCRTYNHGEMKMVSARFAASRLPKALIPDTTYATPPDLKFVADMFIRLQQLRHDADYGRNPVFRRHQVLACVRDARQAFDAWKRVRKTDDARLYLACFLLWDRWDKEPR